jgi:hypothetical protein
LFSSFSAWGKHAKDRTTFKRFAKRHVSRWHNRVILRCFNTLKGVNDEKKRHEMLVRKYAAKLFFRVKAKIWGKWNEYVAAEKSDRYVIQKFARRLKYSVQFQVLNKWKNIVNQTKIYRLAVSRFKFRYMNLTASRAFAAWYDFKEQRIRMKRFTTRWMTRLKSDSLLSAWNSWKNVFFYDKHCETMNEFQAFKEAERVAKAERMMGVALESIRKMMNSCLERTFTSWKGWSKGKKVRQNEKKRTNHQTIERWMLILSSNSLF